ncbi:alpha carbonic anhydrase 7-like [Cornus florida]|uniref:alpha carbonic anhydrase 7-like n=1 Tax=Cornus florida TaxID=4283 RepID=UPI002898E935|nr:alpha carbonic anhydrase 7-like [Cornus florida]
MENLKIKTLCSNTLIVLVLLSVSFQAMSQEVEDERGFSYDEGSENGPEHWGEISSEWSMCSNGEMQSPIDLLNERVQIVSYLGRLKRDYKPSNAALINRGHDMMLKWKDAGHMQINGTKYELRECHWHSPSEHTIDGKRFDLELHLVHESKSKKIAVVGIMYKFGRTDSFLLKMKDHLEAMANSNELERVVGKVDPKQIKIGSRKYYRYIGSLTAPPCTQNVVWTIVRKVRTVTREQVRLLRDAVHDDQKANVRPIQPINTRSVQLYRPIIL